MTINTIKKEYEGECWFPFVEECLLKETPWKRTVIWHYPEPALLEKHWLYAVLCFCHNVHKFYHRKKLYPAGTLPWLLQSILGEATCCLAFERFIDNNTAERFIDYDTASGNLLAAKLYWEEMLEYYASLPDQRNIVSDIEFD